MRRSILAAVPFVILAGCGGGGTGGSGGPSVTIVLNQPFGKLPYVGNFTLQGARLAADAINKAGGVRVGGTAYTINLQPLDDQLSPSTALQNVQKAVSEKAVAIIDDGYTTDATYQAAQAAGIPILIDYDGNTALIDTDKRPGVFRIAPPDDAVAGKLADYVTQRRSLTNLALVHDDSEYGKDGDAQMAQALGKDGAKPALDVELPSSAADYSTQALQVKQSGAAGVVLWARSPVIAAFVKALRQGGDTAPVFSGPDAEDPVVRTQNADHPDYVNGLTYASFRITTESGTDAWDKFRAAYEAQNFNTDDGKPGPDYRVGVNTSKSKPVVQPPDWQIFPYDMVHLVKAALEQAGTVDPTGGKIVTALNSVKITSGNGDNRGWTKDNHEGVADDDIYFAQFVDMEFKPVQDDPLSKSLPPIDQE
jgi:ABC-type branched-subunit amino acid transport system substrate-binding protein